MQALESGVEVVPVWNKSNREHTIIGSEPSSVRDSADAAVKALDWKLPYFCDADHITLETVDRFFAACDFYTIDVADSRIGARRRQSAHLKKFVKLHPELLGRVELELAEKALEITPENLKQTAQKFLGAVKTAGKVYRKIENAKGIGNFIPEISMDETDRAQSPVELLIILAAIADEGIPVQTIAPKFSGRFNKGVDYVGDVAQFESEMALDVAALAYAIQQYGLPENLKLSVHSGSDKFSIYPAIHSTMKRFDAGVHLKTRAGNRNGRSRRTDRPLVRGEALVLLVKETLLRSFLCAPAMSSGAPYAAAVIDIDPARLPAPDEVHGWSSEQYTSALRHVRGTSAYNSNLRQLLHVGFKVAAKMGQRYLDLLEGNETVIAKNVTKNLYDRHIVPIFLGRNA